MTTGSLSYKKIFIFWVPLAATWLMMSVEGPYLAAIIARLGDAKYNLAAYGVAYSFALIVEAPIIMIMSAATALIRDRDSFRKMRNFTFTLNFIITIFMIVILIPPVFYFIAEDLLNLPDNVARLTHHATAILLPWPGAIGFRRLYQGVLIRHNLTRRVAYGTIIRLASMSVSAIVLYLFFDVPGAVVGAAALSTGVTMEAAASRFMARVPVKSLLYDKKYSSTTGEPLNYRFITKFYYPLALTSILGLGIQPMITFFMGQSRLPIESLAVLPVVTSLVFIFRSLGLSFQEVGIALMGDRNEGYAALRNFATILGFGTIICLSIITFTPLGIFWFQTVSGLSPELTRVAIWPARIMAVMPGLTVLLSFQRSVLVNSRATGSITWATAIEVTGILLVLLFSIKYLNVIGAVAAASGFVIGRFMANTFLFNSYFKVLRIPAAERENLPAVK